MFDPRIGACLRRAARLLGRPEPETTDAALLEPPGPRPRPGGVRRTARPPRAGVWALCRRLARTEPDAEDVFQATFLVLARDAARVRKAASVGSWLYGVASRIGRKVAGEERRAPDPARLRAPVPPPDPAARTELERGPGGARRGTGPPPGRAPRPVLLCYFDGMTQDEAAAELGWTARRVKARVARGRELLRARLTRRGIELPAVLAVPLLSAGVAAAVPPHLLAGLASAAADLAGVGRRVRTCRPPRSRWPKRRVRRGRPPTRDPARLRRGPSGRRLARRPSGRSGPRRRPAPRAPTSRPAARRTTRRCRRAPCASAPPQFRQDRVAQAGVLHRRREDPGRAAGGDGRPVLGRGDRQDVPRDPVSRAATRTPRSPRPATSSRSSAGTGRTGTGAKTEDRLWLIDAAARKVVRTVPLPRATRREQPAGAGQRRRQAGVRRVRGRLRVIDAKTGDELIRHKGRINAGALAVSPDGKTVAFGRYDVFLWHWESGEEPKKFASIGGLRDGVDRRSARDGKTLLRRGRRRPRADLRRRDRAADRYARRRRRAVEVVVQPGRQDARHRLPRLRRGPDGRARGRAVGPGDGEGAGAGSRSAGRRRRTSSWSPDGTRLAAATDYRLWAWDVKTGKPLGPSATGHEGFITAFAFGPDGRLFTASDDHTVRSWDAGHRQARPGTGPRLLGARHGRLAGRVARRRVGAPQRPARLGREDRRGAVQAARQRRDGRQAEGAVHARRQAPGRVGRRPVPAGVGHAQRQAPGRAPHPARRRDRGATRRRVRSGVH